MWDRRRAALWALQERGLVRSLFPWSLCQCRRLVKRQKQSSPPRQHGAPVGDAGAAVEARSAFSTIATRIVMTMTWTRQTEALQSVLMLRRQGGQELVFLCGRPLVAHFRGHASL